MRNYRQIALVVRDVEKTMQYWWNVMGIGPWDVRHFTPERVREFHVDDKPIDEDFDFICAGCWVGDIEFELIQPIKGPNIYWRHLEIKGEGLHHIKDVMPDDEIPRGARRAETQGIRGAADRLDRQRRPLLPRHPGRPRPGVRDWQRGQDRTTRPALPRRLLTPAPQPVPEGLHESRCAR